MQLVGSQGNFFFHFALTNIEVLFTKTLSFTSAGLNLLCLVFVGRVSQQAVFLERICLNSVDI